MLSSLFSLFSQPPSSASSFFRIPLESVHFLIFITPRVYVRPDHCCIMATFLSLVFLPLVFIHSVLSLEWPSKIRSLIIWLHTYHRLLQWLPTDFRVKPECLSPVYNTFQGLTSANPPGWSFMKPCFTFCNLHLLSRRSWWSWKEEAKMIRACRRERCYGGKFGSRWIWLGDKSYLLSCRVFW